MAGPVVMGPGEEPAGETPGDQKPSSNGEVKQPGEGADPGSGEPDPGEQDPGEQDPEEPETPAPTVTIETVTDEEDGSITISGTSTNVQAGETVTIVLGDAVTVTATTDASGAWTATVSATEATALTAGTTAVRAATGTATGTSSFEHTPKEVPGHGIIVSTEAEKIKLDIVLAVSGYDNNTATAKERRIIKNQYDFVTSQYGSLFDVETEVGRATFQRFVEYEFKKWDLATNGSPNNDAALSDQLFEEAYGISADYSDWLVFNIYLVERPEDRHLLRRWQTFDIAMEHLLLRIANPDATEEEILELLRESIRAGKVTIAG